MSTEQTEQQTQPQIRMEFYVKQQHVAYFTPEQFADWVETHLRGEGLDPEDLDSVYNRLDQGDWKAEEALSDLADDTNWLDTSSAEMADLQREQVDAEGRPVRT